MVMGELILENTTSVAQFPFPPAAPLLGTEYVLSPPAFSLDELILHTLPAAKMAGKFSNGSFDTKQRYTLSQGRLNLVGPPIEVHYLNESIVQGYSTLPYLSFPRKVGGNEAPSGVQHLYWVHLLEKSPDFDQVVHVTIDLASCDWASAHAPADLVRIAATFVVQDSTNVVTKRLYPSAADPLYTVHLMTNTSSVPSVCTMRVLEEVHCVTVPDSFANCPAVSL
jgi:hypothetical protein